jgi:polar amino acid transport system substrate-binding protein
MTTLETRPPATAPPLVDAVEAALTHSFTDGSYATTLTRWGLSDEAVDKPVVNPQVAS